MIKSERVSKKIDKCAFLLSSLIIYLFLLSIIYILNLSIINFFTREFLAIDSAYAILFTIIIPMREKINNFNNIFELFLLIIDHNRLFLQIILYIINIRGISCSDGECSLSFWVLIPYQFLWDSISKPIDNKRSNQCLS